MFNFADSDTMRKIVTLLPRVGIGTGYGLPQVVYPYFSNIYEFYQEVL